MKIDDSYFDDQYLEIWEKNPNRKISDLFKAVELGSSNIKVQIWVLSVFLQLFKEQLLDIKKKHFENPNLNVLDTENDYWYNWLKDYSIKESLIFNQSREDFEKSYRKFCYSEDIDYENDYKSDYEFLSKYYELNIESIENEISKLELETGSEDQQEVTPETAKQPDKIVLKQGRPKDSKYEKKIIVLDLLETALNLKKKGHKLYLQKNYHNTLIRAFHYYYKHISKAKDKLSKLTLDDIQQIRDADIKKAKNKESKK
jgi:hypothetical protein